jgi:hypothetical protein
MKTLNLEDILAYYLNKLSSSESQRVEAAIDAEPQLIGLLLGLKRLEEELAGGECMETFLEKGRMALKHQLFK